MIARICSADACVQIDTEPARRKSAISTVQTVNHSTDYSLVGDKASGSAILLLKLEIEPKSNQQH